jgi:hypothetical protein
MSTTAAASATSPGTSATPEEGAAKTTGSSINKLSSDVAEGQRLDSAADKGTTINAPTMNNTSGSTGKAPKNIADTYNKSFVGEYYSTA